ncbi:hypothetical protein Ciccas_002872 [Cichlidogyrus casuarinus]|uniref:Ribosomal protein S15 n=1 Tax=Cichlidogyrus casuarinus TaxID=1844966 RepID=A0ABD2QFZ9_9PLAT
MEPDMPGYKNERGTVKEYEGKETTKLSRRGEIEDLLSQLIHQQVQAKRKKHMQQLAIIRNEIKKHRYLVHHAKRVHDALRKFTKIR